MLLFVDFFLVLLPKFLNTMFEFFLYPSFLNNVVSFLKKYVIDEQLDEIYKSENTVRKENISSISK